MGDTTAFKPGPSGPITVKMIDQLDGTYSERVVAGGKCLSRVFTFTRPANQTPYTAKDAVGANLTVSAATNASPIVVTTTTHGLADGDFVTISGIVGNTAGNGGFYVKVTGYTTLTFALYSDKALASPVAGNGAWSSGGAVARMFRLKGLFRSLGGDGYITKIRLTTDLSTWTDQFALWFYGAPTAALLDNAVFAILYANRDLRLGSVVMPAFATEGSGSDMAYAIGVPNNGTTNLPLYVRNLETVPDTDLWVRIEDLSAGTPGSAQNFSVEVTLDAN